MDNVVIADYVRSEGLWRWYLHLLPIVWLDCGATKSNSASEIVIQGMQSNDNEYVSLTVLQGKCLSAIDMFKIQTFVAVLLSQLWFWL